MSHFKTVCKVCEKIVNQCRCASRNKTVQYTTCPKCLADQVPDKPAEVAKEPEKLFIWGRESGKELTLIKNTTGGIEIQIITLASGHKPENIERITIEEFRCERISEFFKTTPAIKPNNEMDG